MKRFRTSTSWEAAGEIVGEHRRALAFGLVLLVVGRVAALVVPASSKVLFDDILSQHRTELLAPVLAAGAAATVVHVACEFLLAQVLGVAAHRAVSETRIRVQAHVMRLPLQQLESVQTGAMVSRVMTDAEGVRSLIGTSMVQLVGGALTAVISLGVLLWLNWRLTAITAGVLVLFAAALASSLRALRPMFRERNRITAEVSGRLVQALNGIRVVKAYTAEKREEIVFTRSVHRLLRAVVRSTMAVSGAGAASSLITGVIGLAIMMVGGRSVLAGNMTPGELIMYLLFVGAMAGPLMTIASAGTQVTEAFAALDRVREMMRLRTEREEHAGRMPVEHVAGDVRFENVSFEYTPKVPVLRDISFHAAAGSTTAFVGVSGSGKTTLIRLILAFNRPTAGRVSIDNRDLARLDLREYRHHVGAVLQETVLFDASIADNVRYARPHASRAEVEEACRLACCDEFVRQHERGFDAIVGEHGLLLSGGQRQRVAIARAVLANPRILVLDEATSNLDVESEQMVHSALRQLQRGRTTFVIAHRIATIQGADQIIVLHQGRIVERGTHAELLRLNGRYRLLYDKQRAALAEGPLERDSAPASCAFGAVASDASHAASPAAV